MPHIQTLFKRQLVAFYNTMQITSWHLTVSNRLRGIDSATR